MAKTFKNRPNQAYNVGGRTVWESRSAAVVAVVVAYMNSNYYVLINKRGPGAADNQGKWNLCCGYVDFDETGPEALVREVYEETGVDLDEIKTTKKILFNSTEQPFYVNTDPKENRQNISLSYGIVFETDSLPDTSSEYSEENEIADIKWMNIKDIEQYDFAFGHDKRIKMYLSNTFKIVF